MLRRILISAIVLLLAISIAIGFVFIKKKSASMSNPLKSIPIDAAFILRINDFHKFEKSLIYNNSIWSELSKLEQFQKINSNLRFIDSLTVNNSGLTDALYKSSIFISGHYIGGKKSDILYIINFETGYQERRIIDIIDDNLVQNIKNTERKYEGKSIYTVKLSKNDSKNIYLALIEGNLLISKSIILIENAIRQLSISKSLTDDKEFMQISSTSGKNKLANLYIDQRKITSVLTFATNNDFRQKLKDYKNFGGWTELDFNETEKRIMLNGFVDKGLDNKEQKFLNLFNDNEPVRITVDKVLPASVSTFYTFAAEDITLLNENFNLYLKHNNKDKIRDNKLKEIENKTGIKPGDLFNEIIEEEIALAFGLKEASFNEVTKYVVIKCKSGRHAQSELNTLAKKLASAYENKTDKINYTYSVDRETKYIITKISYENLTGLLFGNMFDIKGNSYFTFIGNYLITGESVEALGHFIYNNVLSKTLSTNEAYKSFTGNIAQKSFFLFYSNISRSPYVFRKYLDEEIIDSWESNIEIFSKVQPFGLQITEVSNMTYCNMLIEYVNDIKGKPKTIWESLLDTSFAIKPQFVINHYTKQKEIFLQDLDNNIYLINKAGRVLWKQKISESVNSDIFQIDYYKNGKMQIMFSTNNYLHLIDRNGNYVERYPVRLRTEASAGMSLFDYELNKNYRIFIPCVDQMVYAYSKEGSILNGWQFSGADKQVNQPINHFRINNKDFIVFGDESRVYILNRRGSVRITVDQLIEKSVNNNFYLDDKQTLEKSRIVTTNTKGEVVLIDFSGNVTTERIAEFSSMHYFDFQDVDTDGIKDYIFLDGSALKVYRQDKSKILNIDFPQDFQLPPIYFHFSYNDRKIGLVDSEDNKIYLINNDGSIYKGFPLEGKTLFSIGYLEEPVGTFNLIVGGRNNFLYNYTVQ
ncbi:MAG: DUF3352 domain-containing protein [Bacteroidales bacterium]|nr:DUF3352 domain-containing protein [Bacteroidales bacterium]